jgi:hypothetical protein
MTQINHRTLNGYTSPDIERIEQANIYFPPLYGDVECYKCEKEGCHSRGKEQRKRRDFTTTSGRCPRLADKRGFVDREERELYSAIFPLVHAELGVDEVTLSLQFPNEKKLRKVYNTGESQFWYYKTKDADGDPIRRLIWIDVYHTKESIIDAMKWASSDYCLFRCIVTDDVV